MNLIFSGRHKEKPAHVLLQIGITAAGIILFILVLIRVCSSYKSSPSVRGNTTGNILEYGSILDCEAGIFYADNGIMRSDNKDASTAYEIYPHPAMYLNYYDGWIYFCDTFEGYHLYRMRPDGTQTEELIDMHCEFVNILDGTLYFAVSDYSGGSDKNTRGIYSASLSGENLTKLSEADAFRMTVYKDRIYYIDKDTSLLTAIKYNGQDKEIVYKNPCYTYAFYENTLYVAARDGIYSAKLRDSGYELVLPVKASSLIADRERLFYCYTDFLGTGREEPLSMFHIKTGRTDVLLDETCFVPCIGFIQNQLLVQMYSLNFSCDMYLISLTTGERVSLPGGSFSMG